jgi:D-amino-acid dehydrogenase
MRIIVLGGGVVGVATAYFLARAGHQVTVVDRQVAVARETSFANAGLIAPGHSYTWNSPRAPLILLKSLWRDDMALRFHLSADPRMWAWSLRFLANCTAARSRKYTIIKLKLCLYSQQVLNETAGETGVAYDAVNRGVLYLYRDQGHLARGVATMALLSDHGARLEAVDPERCVEIEPALAGARDRIAGAIFAPGDASGDSRKFSEGLAARCRDLGVVFEMGRTITAIRGDRSRIDGIDTDRGPLTADHYVLALGSYSPLLARGLGLDLPVYPVKGYSATLPTEGGPGVPYVGGVDEANLVAYCRMGDRLRLTATADFAGYDTAHRPADFTQMLGVARDLFPRGGAYDKPDYWACLRPMTPDGPPILGPCRVRNLTLNTGHGHMGWTMACGSARIVADMIDGRTPAIDTAGLTLERY